MLGEYLDIFHYNPGEIPQHRRYNISVEETSNQTVSMQSALYTP